MKMTKEQFLEMCEQELTENEEQERAEKVAAINNRNRQMYEDKLHNGFTYDQLAEKYALTRERCRQIVFKECRKREWVDNTIHLLFQYYPDVGQNIIIRSFNAFLRSRPSDIRKKMDADFAVFCEELSKTTDDQLASIRNLGIKSFNFLSTVRSDFRDLKSESYITVSDLIRLLEILPRTAPVLYNGKPIQGIADILGEDKNKLNKKVVANLL